MLYVRKAGKIIADSFQKAITNLLTGFFTFLLYSIIPILLTLFVLDFQKPITIPMYILVILGLFALLGVIIPASRIIRIFTKKHSNDEKRKIQKVRFENHPREWRAVCNNDGIKWIIRDPDVYCTIHNLKLEVTVFRSNSARYFAVSECSDCFSSDIDYYKSEEDNLYRQIPSGCALHSEKDYFIDFQREVKNRILRELENESHPKDAKL
jgi:hypothetical protein